MDGVDDAGGIEELCDDDRGIQVVIEGCIGTLLQSTDLREARLGRRLEPVEEGIGVEETLEPLLSCLQSLVAEVYRTSVVSAEDEEADGHRAVGLVELLMLACEEFIERDEVPQ